MIDPARIANLSPERIGIIKPTAFGDVVQSIPILPPLRQRWPAAKISWVISRPLMPLLSGHPCVDELIAYDRRGGIRGWSRLLGRLWRSRFDLVFDLQGLARTGLMTLATRARVRVGLETAREGSSHTCNVLLPRSGRDVGAHQRYWRVAETLGLENTERRTDIWIPQSDAEQVADMLGERNGPVLAIHPGARWATKCWPPEKFAVVADRAASELGARVIIVGTADDENRAQTLVGSLSNRNGVLNLAGKTSIKQLAALLGSADAVLCNDSGPMHLAAGLGTPVCAVFTCTSPLRSGPPGEHHQLIASGLPCAAGYHKRCPMNGDAHLACFADVDVDRVWSGLARILNGTAVSAA